MSRITYHCDNCGDPDAPDADHIITCDRTFYWCIEVQDWKPSDPNDCDLFCSHCGELGSPHHSEVELPDLSPAEELALAQKLAQDQEAKTAEAWLRVRKAEADIEARQAAHQAEADREARLRDAAPALLSLLFEALIYSEDATLEGDDKPDFAVKADALFRQIETGEA
jgi:hypothetical protein